LEPQTAGVANGPDEAAIVVLSESRREEITNKSAIARKIHPEPRIPNLVLILTPACCPQIGLKNSYCLPMISFQKRLTEFPVRQRY